MCSLQALWSPSLIDKSNFSLNTEVHHAQKSHSSRLFVNDPLENASFDGIVGVMGTVLEMSQQEACILSSSQGILPHIIATAPYGSNCHTCLLTLHS